MKKIKLFVITLISLIFIPGVVNAASANVSVTSSSQVVVGKKVTVTVKLSSSSAIGSWEMQLNYDKNYLQLTSSTAEGGGNYMVSAATTKDGIKSKSYTFTFKTLKTGSTNLSIGSVLVYDNNMDEMDVSAGKKTIKVITQQQLEDSYSKDNNLKSLSIEGYSLSPSFSASTTNYSVNVPEGTTSVKINATASDSKASISGDGAVSVTEGINTINVVVRAENGSEKTYVILVNVIDQNPINVKIDNLNYTVIKLRNNYICPQLFTESEVTINGLNIPACYNDKVNYTLVGLKKDDGTVENFIYDNGNYHKYIETVGTSLKVIILDYDKELPGLAKYQEEIDGQSYQIFKASSNSSNYVVYALNIETGEKDFYNYDTINKTFTLYDKERIDELNKLNETYLYIIIAFGIGLFLAIVSLISTNISKKKTLKKNDELKKEIEKKKDIVKEEKKDKKKKKKQKEDKEKIEESIIKEDINEVKEIVNKDEEETKEFYDIFEDDKKKKK